MLFLFLSVRFIYNELLIFSLKVNVNVEVFKMVLFYTICNVILLVK